MCRGQEGNWGKDSSDQRVNNKSSERRWGLNPTVEG